jgi:hypothetical protein
MPGDREVPKGTSKGQGGNMESGMAQRGPKADCHSLSCTDTEESVTLVLRRPPGSMRFLALCRKWTKRRPGPYWWKTCDTCRTRRKSLGGPHHPGVLLPPSVRPNNTCLGWGP